MKSLNAVWAVVSVGLIASTALLFSAVKQLRIKLDDLSIALAAETGDRENGDNTLRSDLSTRESVWGGRLQKAEAEATARSNELKTAFSRLVALELDATNTVLRLSELSGRLGSLHSMAQDTSNRLAVLRRDATGDVQEMFKRELHESATKQAVLEFLVSGMLVKDPKFIAEVANVLTSEHRLRLRGDPGSDAKNEIVAEMLKHDIEFIDLVRESIVLMGADSVTNSK